MCRNFIEDCLFVFLDVRPSMTSTDRFLSITLWFTSQQNNKHFNQNRNHEHVFFHIYIHFAFNSYSTKWRTLFYEVETPGSRSGKWEPHTLLHSQFHRTVVVFCDLSKTKWAPLYCRCRFYTVEKAKKTVIFRALCWFLLLIGWTRGEATSTSSTPMNSVNVSELWGSHSGIAESLILLGYYAAYTGK
jgi:hypothetical protein